MAWATTGDGNDSAEDDEGEEDADGAAESEEVEETEELDDDLRIRRRTAEARASSDHC